MPTNQPPQNIAIIGGGIAGISTAYFLANSPALPPGAKITVVEGTEIAAAASGKSGGFLAKDWHGTPTASLSAMSYDLHAELAGKYGGAEKWGYRTVDTLSVETDATRKSKRAPPVSWLPPNVLSSRSLGDHRTTAQVHPGLLTKFLADQTFTSPNTKLVIGRAVSVKQEDGASRSVVVKTTSGEQEIPADCVVLAAGPWTGKLAVTLLGKKVGGQLGVEGHRAHSIVLKTKETLSAHCLFTSMTLEDGSAGEPEVYTRPDGTTYICGAGDNEPLPDTAADVKASPDAIAKLHKQAHALSHVFDSSKGEADVVAEQACFLPIADRGRPLVGKVKGVEGVYIGSGLSCWGITQGPGMGKCLAEMILEGKAKSADISRLAP